MEVDFDSTLGAIYVGVAITACLCGISTLHGYTYWNHRKQDSAITRISMAVLWLADAAKLVCATHIGYRLLITEYQNDPEGLYYTIWSINVSNFTSRLRPSCLHYEDGTSADHFNRLCDTSVHRLPCMEV
ncbi:unnamed protein product [Rhizoctonia solani]|nr:unnamed protein product [Rhizoctonia solani]